MSTRQVRAHLRRCENDAGKARANLAGLLGATAPHLKGIKSDTYITGSVGGRARPPKVRAVWVDDAEHCEKIRYNEPVVRAGRPANTQGSTSFHLSFEVISKAQLELGLRTKQGRKASPSDHVSYIEREEAAAAIISGEPSPQPSPPEEFVGYQERDGALAPSADGDFSPIITNIPGDQSDRMQFFAAIAERAEMERAPSLSISLDTHSGLMDKIRFEIDSGRLSEFKERVEGNSLTLSGAAAEDAVAVLAALGWRDRRKKQARASRQEDAFGICHDPGKSDRVQFRLVGELPHEIGDHGRRRMLKRLCNEFEKRNLPYIAVMHAPGAGNDARNWHFHLVYHDRPATRFDGTAETHLTTTDANDALSSRSMASKAKWLNAPSIQAQVGLWDFQVRAEWKTKSRNSRVSYPFAQRKDRDVTRKSFVPGLRALLSEVTNEELQRAGVERRVDPLSHKQAGRKVAAGEKLFAADHARELAGIPTLRGSSNARLQSDYRNDQLDLERGLAFERSYISDDERHRAETFLGSRKLAYRMLRELADARKELAVLESVKRQADNVTEELFSRPRMMTERNQQLMLDAYKKPKSQGRVADYARQLGHIHEHVQSMKMLGDELFQIGRDAENALAAVDDRILTLEISVGLRAKKSSLFDDVAKTEHISAPEAAKVPHASRHDLRVKASSVHRPPAEASRAAEQQLSANRSPLRTDTTKARGQAVSAHIDKIYDNRIPFDLKSTLRANKTVWTAAVSQADASRHGIPVAFELGTKLHESRLIGLARERANLARGLEPVAGHEQSVEPQPPIIARADNTGVLEQTSDPTAAKLRREMVDSSAEQEHLGVRAVPKRTESGTNGEEPWTSAAAPQPSAEKPTFADRHFPRTGGQNGRIQQAAEPNMGPGISRSEVATSVSPTKGTGEQSNTPSRPWPRFDAPVAKPIVKSGDATPAEAPRNHDNIRPTGTGARGETLPIESLDVAKRASADLSRRAKEIYDRVAAKNASNSVADTQSSQAPAPTGAMVDIEAWRKVAAAISMGAFEDRGKYEIERDRLAFVARRHVIADPSLGHRLLSGERDALEAQVDRWMRRLRQNGLSLGLGR